MQARWLRWIAGGMLLSALIMGNSAFADDRSASESTPETDKEISSLKQCLDEGRDPNECELDFIDVG